MNATSAVRSRPALSPPSSFLSRRFTRCSMSMPKLRLRTPSPPHATTNGRENTPDSALLAASDEEVGKPRGSRDVQLELARRVHASSWLPVADPAPNAKPIEPAYGGSFLKESRVRATWLLGLLVLQSLSSFVLEANQALIKEHLVVTLFLTMLVGAGGNSGSGSASNGSGSRASRRSSGSPMVNLCVIVSSIAFGKWWWRRSGIRTGSVVLINSGSIFLLL